MKSLFKNSTSKKPTYLIADIFLHISSSRKMHVSSIFELLEYTEYTSLHNLGLKSHNRDYHLEHSGTKKILSYRKISSQEGAVEFIKCCSDFTS